MEKYQRQFPYAKDIDYEQIIKVDVFSYMIDEGRYYNIKKFEKLDEIKLKNTLNSCKQYYKEI